MTVEEYLKNSPKALKNCKYVLNELMNGLHNKAIDERRSCIPEAAAISIALACDMLNKNDLPHAINGIIQIANIILGRGSLFDKTFNGMAEEDGEGFIKIFIAVSEYFIILDMLCEKSIADSDGKLLAGFSLSPKGFIGYDGATAGEGGNRLRVPNTRHLSDSLSTYIDLGGADEDNHDFIRLRISVLSEDFKHMADTGTIGYLPVYTHVFYAAYTGEEYGAITFHNTADISKDGVLSELRKLFVDQINECKYRVDNK